MSVKLLTEHNLLFLGLTGGCTGTSESTHVKMPHCCGSLLFLKQLSQMVKQALIRGLGSYRIGDLPSLIVACPGLNRFCFYFIVERWLRPQTQ